MEARSCSRPPTEGPPVRSARPRRHVGRAQPTAAASAQRPAEPRPPDVSGKRRRRRPLPEAAGAARGGTLPAAREERGSSTTVPLVAPLVHGRPQTCQRQGSSRLYADLKTQDIFALLSSVPQQ